MSVRSLLMKLLEFITCLGSLSSRYFAADTPSLTILQTAVIDLIYGSSRRRPGNFSCYFPFYYDSFKVFDGPLSFVDDSFATWFDFTKNAVSASIDIFSRNFTGFSVAHADFANVTAQVNYRFLPLIELESAFSGFLTFIEPSTLETP